jgi:hypothetical protein
MEVINMYNLQRTLTMNSLSIGTRDFLTILRIQTVETVMDERSNIGSLAGPIDAVQAVHSGVESPMAGATTVSCDKNAIYDVAAHERYPYRAVRCVRDMPKVILG